MVIGSDRRIGPSAVERSAASATAAMSAAAETLQSHLEFVLDERAGRLNHDQRRFLDMAVRHGDRLIRLLEDMRLVALAESGRLEPVWSRFDLAATAEAVVEKLWPLAHVQGKALSVEHEGPVWVDADEERVARALLALVADAALGRRQLDGVAVVVEDGRVELLYEGEALPSEIGLALAEAVAGLHGGDLFLQVGSGGVSLLMSLGAPASVPAAA